MRTIQKTVFEFSELSDDAKERARQWFRSGNDDCFFAESVIEDAVHLAAVFGLDIDAKTWTNSYGFSGSTPCVYWSGFSHQGDGASYTGRYSYVKGAAAKIAYETGNDTRLVGIVDRLQAIQKRYFYGLVVCVSTSGRYSHEYSMNFDVVDRNGNNVDANVEEEIAGCLRDFARWIYSNLEKEYEFVNSDEYIDDTIEANEYEFYENGEKA